MEIKRTRHIFNCTVRFIVWLFISAISIPLLSQKPIARSTVKQGKMFIEITKDIPDSMLNSFVIKFDLKDLYLIDFIKKNKADSLKKHGWIIEKNNEVGFIISKSFSGPGKLWDPVDRMIFTEKHPTFAERFPSTNNGILYGHNRFKNGYGFRQHDSIIVFHIKNNRAKSVMLAGSFNDWNPNTLAMKKTDSGWVRELKLRPGKYWYKFIVDGEWRVDENNQVKENDGFGNINSVLFVTNADFFLKGFLKARNVSVAGSFNQWGPKELIMVQTGEGWTSSLYLADGTHTYKFVADRQWITDENNKNRLPDGNGGFNSVIAIGKSHTFKLNAYENAKEVRLAGSFNNWRDFELPMKKSRNGWEISYVLGPGNYEYKFWVDGKFIADPSNPSLAGNGNSLLVISPNYTFRLKGYENAKKVVLAGNFNNWNPNAFAMLKEDNEWVFPVHLSVGKHLYKFIVDGEWIKDPNNKLWEHNEFDTGNSIIWIDK
jgi:hypothetical protein